MSDDRDDMLGLLSAHARDGVAFQCLGSWGRLFRTNHGGVGHAVTATAWVAAGGPWCTADRLVATASAFITAAHDDGRRAVFFAVEERQGLEHLRALRIGERAVLDPAAWPATLACHRRLREQLRRARKKGVRVRRLGPGELHAGHPLRHAAEQLLANWVRTRHLEPLGFLAAAEPFVWPDHHRYYLAEGPGGPLSLMSLIPAPALRTWLVEHTLRDPAAPNGTSELLLDAALRDAEPGERISLGLLPLAGEVPLPLRLARRLAAPLYDFDSLARFKRRLHPHHLEPVWLLSPGRPAVALLDALRAFAGDHLLRFAARSLWRRPNCCCWLLAMALLPWTAGLAAALGSGHAWRLGLSPRQLAGIITWDAGLAWFAFGVAHRPTRTKVGGLVLAAALDAAFSIEHVAAVGFGSGLLTSSLRLISAVGPLLGTGLLLHALWRCGP